MENTNTIKHDEIIRFLFDNHGVRGEIINLKKSCEDLIHKDYPKAIKSIMMELGAAALMFAATLKDGSEVMLQIQGDKNAPLKYALVNVREDMTFYGSAKLNEGFNELDDSLNFKELVGEKGILALSVFPVEGQKWQGIVALEGNSVADALEGYFKNSQQLPSRFIIFSDADKLACQGLMLQIIPNIDGNNDSLEHLAILSGTLSKEESLGLSNEEILNRLFAYEQVRVFPAKKISFRCICSSERCLKALASLKREALKEIADDPNGTEMTCQHCGKTYHFSHEELQSLLCKVSQ